jgi:hypothetical protein
MRLTLVISSLGRGGAERALSLLANAWAEQGKEVTVLRLDHGEAPAYPIHASVKLSSLGLLAESHNPFQGIWRSLYRIRILRRAISESHPDMVIGTRRAYYHPWLPYSEFIRPLEQGMTDAQPRTIFLAQGEPALT